MRTRLLTTAALLMMPFLGGCDEGSGPSVSGTISLAPEHQKVLGASDTLFVIARPKGAEQGPPMAVLRIVGMKFPVKYTITQEDVLQPNTPFQGEMTVQAFIKKSGFVGMSTPGDMEGAYDQPVSVGATNVDFAIDTISK